MAEADAEYSAFYQVNGTNISCKPIQVKGLVSLDTKSRFFVIAFQPYLAGSSWTSDQLNTCYKFLFFYDGGLILL